MVRKFIDYINEERGKEYFTGSNSVVGSQGVIDNPIFKIKMRGLDNPNEQPARQSKEEKDSIEKNDVIIGKNSDGKKKIGRVIKIHKDSEGTPVKYEISTKNGKLEKIDASKVLKKDYHEERTNSPYHSTRVM